MQIMINKVTNMQVHVPIIAIGGHEMIFWIFEPRLSLNIDRIFISNSPLQAFFHHYPWSMDTTPYKAWIVPKLSLQEIHRWEIFDFENFSYYYILVGHIL